MVWIGLQGTTTNRESKPLRAPIIRCTTWAMRWIYTIPYYSDTVAGPIITLGGAFVAMKVLKLFFVDYSRQTLFSNFCTFTTHE